MTEETTSNQKFLQGSRGRFFQKESPGKKKKFFENLAKDWDDEHHTLEEIERTRIFAETHFPLKKAETILDVGCGTGRLIPQLKKTIGETGILVEMDFSIEMLKIGKKRYDYRNLLFIQGDGHVLPIKTRSIDTVICFAFFPHLADKLKGMQAFARVLKPGGKLIIAHQMSREELNRFHGEVDGPVNHDSLPDENKMKELFETAGFRDIDIEEGPGFYLAAAYLQGEP
ncbi:MAG: class I SAM-dependent methyltransferase [Candidatus Aminicenantes bacterium]|jgi:ubiquinone/menaquinone biosynthesis C-methylase UbiE